LAIDRQSDGTCGTRVQQNPPGGRPTVKTLAILLPPSVHTLWRRIERDARLRWGWFGSGVVAVRHVGSRRLAGDAGLRGRHGHIYRR